MGLPGKKICCCSETGLTCQCIASGGICGIFWHCADDTSTTIRSEKIRILKDGVVVLESTDILGFYPLPEETDAIYKIQVCCELPCRWRTLWEDRLDNTADEHCSIIVEGGIYEINASSLGPPDEPPTFECDAILRIVGAAAREDPVSPLIAELGIVGTTVFTGLTSEVGCIPDGARSECHSGPVVDLSCVPSQIDFTGTYYIDIYYPIPVDQAVIVHAINLAGDVQACSIDIPCYWHYDTIRVEIPTWEGQSLSCNGGDPKPIGFDFSLGNRWRQTWSTESEITASLGGTYIFYSCSLPDRLIISTGTFRYTYTETGRLAYHTSAAPLVRLESAYTRRYTYEGEILFLLEAYTLPGVVSPWPWGPGYTKFGQLTTDPTYFPVYMRVRPVFVDNELAYDVDLSLEDLSGSFTDPSPIVTTGVQTDAYFVNTLMAVTDVERDIDCAEEPDSTTEITWELKTPFDYAVVYDPPTDPPSSLGDFPLPPIGGVNGGAIGTPGDACSCINEGDQTTTTETLLLAHSTTIP